jgi:hypothetical protein
MCVVLEWHTVSEWARSFIAALTDSRASVAQGIEHRSPKAGVVRSNRIGGTTENCRSEYMFALACFSFCEPSNWLCNTKLQHTAHQTPIFVFVKTQWGVPRVPGQTLGRCLAVPIVRTRWGLEASLNSLWDAVVPFCWPFGSSPVSWCLALRTGLRTALRASHRKRGVPPVARPPITRVFFPCPTPPRGDPQR